MPQSYDRVASLKRILELLNGLSAQVRLLNSAAEGSINTHVETTYMRALNHIYGLNLTNLNHLTANFPSVDLIDESQKLAVQITATGLMAKVDNTLEKFFIHQLDKKIDKLWMVITTDKPGPFSISQLKLRVEKFATVKVAPDFFKVIDNSVLYKDIVALNSSAKNSELIKILEDEMGTLAKVLDRITAAPKDILAAFSDDNYPIAIGVIEKLLPLNTRVYHNSPRLQDDLGSKFNNIYFLADVTDSPMDFCFLLLSDIFIKEKWTKKNSCNILSTALNQESATIIPYYHNLNMRIPTSISSGYLAIPAPATISDCQTIANSIIGRFDPGYKANAASQLQEYRDFERILQFTGSSFIYRSIKIDKSLGFQVFEQTSPFNNLKTLFVFMFPSVDIQKSFKAMEKEYGSENMERAWLLVLKDPNRKESNIRFENIKKTFSPFRMMYLEQYIWEFCTPEEFRLKSEKFDVRDFVTPNLRDESERAILLDDLTKWLQIPKQPVLVIKGSGGIGKTTLAQALGNYFIDENPNSRVIFIDSREILNNLRNRRDPSTSIDLYSFYDATAEFDSHLDNQKFIVNMDHGNILMIIDGLDEVMASIPQFDTNEFFKSIKNYTPSMGNGKVIITCRNYFWDSSLIEHNSEISCVEILPFDDELAITYFEIRHKNSPGRVAKSMKLAHRLAYYSSSAAAPEYLPFVLSIIDDWVEEQQIEDDEEQEPDELFHSTYLNEKNPSDYILHGIFMREQLKMNEKTTVDKQVKLFVDFALSNITPTNHVDPNPQLLKSQFVSLMRSVFPEISKSEILSLLAHAFIEVHGEVVSFRFDFLADYFKNIHVSHILNTGDVPDYKFIMILSSQAKYYSAFVKDICLRIEQNLDEDSPLMFRMVELMDYIIANLDDLDQLFIYKAVSGLFSIALQIKNKKKNPNVISNTELMLNFFETDKQIKNFALVDIISFDDSKKIYFDFSDLKFQNCYFNNYAYFWGCRTNADTKFTASHFKNMQGEDISASTTISLSQFPDCDMDNSFRQVLERLQPGPTKITELKMDDLRRLLALFQVQGRLSQRSFQHVLAKKYVKRIFPLEQLVSFLTKHGIINSLPDQRDSLFISANFQPDIQRFLNHGASTPNLKRITKALLGEPIEK